MLARSLEQVFAWRRVTGSVGRLHGSGGKGRRFGTAVRHAVREKPHAVRSTSGPTPAGV